MAFVNEYIPKEDYEKYKIKEIDKQAPGTLTASAISICGKVQNAKENIYSTHSIELMADTAAFYLK